MRRHFWYFLTRLKLVKENIIFFALYIISVTVSVCLSVFLFLLSILNEFCPEISYLLCTCEYEFVIQVRLEWSLCFKMKIKLASEILFTIWFYSKKEYLPFFFLLFFFCYCYHIVLKIISSKCSPPIIYTQMNPHHKVL